VLAVYLPGIWEIIVEFQFNEELCEKTGCGMIEDLKLGTWVGAD